MAQPTARLIRLLILIAVCAVVASIVGQLVFPGNFKRIILGWLILSVVVLLVPFLSWYLEPTTGPTPRKDLISIFVSITSSLILIGSLALGWLSLDITQQQTEKTLKLSTEALNSAREEQRSRRFMDALEKLGGESLYPRLAGVVAFQKLDEEVQDKREHWLIMDVLTDFIQLQAPRNQRPGQSPNVEKADVLSALKYLSRRKLTMDNGGEPSGLNLSKTNLSGYMLSGPAITDCANAEELNFKQVDFSESNLQGIELKCAKLKGANFKHSDLRGARLDYADLTDVELTEADLRGTLMGEANCGECETLKYAVTDAETRCPKDFANESGKCVPTSAPTPSPTPSPTP